VWQSRLWRGHIVICSPIIWVDQSLLLQVGGYERNPGFLCSGVAMVLFHHMYAHIPEPRCQCRAQHLAMCPRRHQRTPWKIESPITTRAVGRGSAAATSTFAVNAKHDMICAVHSQKGIACCTVSVMQRGGDFAKLCVVVLLMLRLTKCRSRLTECLLTCKYTFYFWAASAAILYGFVCVCVCVCRIGWYSRTTLACCQIPGCGRR